MSGIQVSRIWRSTQRQPAEVVLRKSNVKALAAGKVEFFHFQLVRVHRGVILSEIRAIKVLTSVLVATTEPEATFLKSASAIAKTPKLCINRAKLLSRNFAYAILRTPCAATG